ncbi:MAG: radical SAM protein [Desulfitibacter sp. BRH_c19]|nr:MAG: radical SAM protein [Desulfitibacter sp. BRH_c19]
MKNILESEVLGEVEKPARYLGNEFNSVHKDWDKVSVKMAFCFPDVYEIAMSHLGLRILYGLVNETEEFLMERCFAPWVDMEGELRKRDLPLFSLESTKPLKEFDVLGFTLQYEMSYTNILNMLDLGGIPLLQRDRDESYPLVIAGGPCAFNPEPLADFIDFFLLGDSEELLLEVLGQVRDKYLQGSLKKDEFLKEISSISGVYVPRLYDFEYNEEGTVETIIHPENDKGVRRRIVQDFDKAYFPVKPIVPFVEAVHDRVMLEVARGCTRGCRFCQAGILYRPVREKSPETLQKQAQLSLENTGYEEISLTSLSSADYSCIEQVTRGLLDKHESDRVSLSLPSLRVDAFSVNLAKEIQKVRKTGLTFAPEAGTQRLRDVINKGVTEEDLERSVTGAFQEGWNAIKLYFMIGLPTETEDDLKGIAALAHKVLTIGKNVMKRQNSKGTLKISVSVSSFVPKPHTPFQWEPQDTIEVLKQKQKYLRDLLKDKKISYSYHSPQISLLEAVVSRGDRRLGKVLKRAWEKGCKFDSWDEFFKYEKWLEAFDENNLDPTFYAYRKRDKNEVFPWDLIDVGVTKSFLYKEYEKAMVEARSYDCRLEPCSGCGVCSRFDVNLDIKGKQNETTG